MKLDEILTIQQTLNNNEKSKFPDIEELQKLTTLVRVLLRHFERNIEVFSIENKITNELPETISTLIQCSIKWPQFLPESEVARLVKSITDRRPNLLPSPLINVLRTYVGERSSKKLRDLQTLLLNFDKLSSLKRKEYSNKNMSWDYSSGHNDSEDFFTATAGSENSDEFQDAASYIEFQNSKSYDYKKPKFYRKNFDALECMQCKIKSTKFHDNSNLKSFDRSNRKLNLPTQTGTYTKQTSRSWNKLYRYPENRTHTSIRIEKQQPLNYTKNSMEFVYKANASAQYNQRNQRQGKYHEQFLEIPSLSQFQTDKENNLTLYNNQKMSMKNTENSPNYRVDQLRPILKREDKKWSGELGSNRNYIKSIVTGPKSVRWEDKDFRDTTLDTKHWEANNDNTNYIKSILCPLVLEPNVPHDTENYENSMHTVHKNNASQQNVPQNTENYKNSIDTLHKNNASKPNVVQNTENYKNSMDTDYKNVSKPNVAQNTENNKNSMDTVHKNNNGSSNGHLKTLPLTKQLKLFCVII